MKRWIILLLWAGMAWSQNRLIVEGDAPAYPIPKYLFGHFAEHLGGCIYGGIWVGPESKIPNVDGYRLDVLEALKALEIPVLRWPGGCFADIYHWKDGVGPRENRPKTKNVFWGGVIEDNSFGTHEFLDLCERLGCDPYVSVNVGSGSIVEMIEWIEYMTSDEDIPMANWRRANGREKPWRVRFLGIGNESWGCGGNMTAEYYADLLRQYANYAYQYGRSLIRVGCGSYGEDFNWTRVLMEKARSHMEALSLHYYTIAGAGWHDKGPATGFGEDLYFNALFVAGRIDEFLARHVAIMDAFDPEKKVGLFVDEWGIWTDVEPGTNPAFLFQQNSLRDALLAARTLDVYCRYAERVRMANIAQTVNVLQAMVLTQGEKMLLTPTYHVFMLYKRHKEAKYLPVRLMSESYAYGDRSLQALSATASLGPDGKIHLTVSNVDPRRTLQLEVPILGRSVTKVEEAQVLTGDRIDAVNTFDHPEHIRPKPFKAVRIEKSGTLRIEMPPKALVALTIR